MIDPIILSSAVLALVVTPMLAPADQQRGQAPAPVQSGQGHPAVAQAIADGVSSIGGFNVVLVVGEVSPSDSAPRSPELPAAARHALNDMRDFLPYKHYRVLDSQWMSCCAVRFPSTVRGRLEGLAPAGNTSTSKPFAFAITVSSSYGNIPVRFALIPDEPGAQASPASAERIRELERERLAVQGETELVAQQIEMTQKRIEVGTISSAELPPLVSRYNVLKRKLSDITLSIEEAGTGASGRALIDSSFTMKAGETVVVGTSRLGGDKALIALVTAVRKNPTSKNP